MNPKIRLVLSVLDKMPRKGSSIFVCSTHDIMGPWIPDEWIQGIIERISHFPQHSFLFLSKNPGRYEDFTWPENAHLGMTITKNSDLGKLKDTQGINFISFEPLLEDIAQQPLPQAEWYIIGGLTPKPVHRPQWVSGIIDQANTKKIQVFIKDNTRYNKTIQDFPLWRGEDDV